MKNISVITTIMFLCASFVEAQQLNVIQVKGNRAIVEVQTGEKLKVGESYAVGKVDGEVSLDPVAAGKGSRNYLVGLSLVLSNTKADTAGAQSNILIDTTASFGWNKKQYEYGPIVSLRYTKTGSTSTDTTFGIGGFGTYNFQPNIIGTDLIFSGDADFTYNSISSETLGIKSSSNSMEMNVGPFAKWYGISDDHCIRGGVVFAWEKASGGGNSVTTTGVKAVVGISTYF
ncbi:hypothetical protein [Pseudobdellovibrio sp. HCB154]|uniref:hypothetical protein n=1 Tax=Pseudobdellovibrio sp. HCB154 TaxID=3386277 RepID=UPI003916FB5A